MVWNYSVLTTLSFPTHLKSFLVFNSIGNEGGGNDILNIFGITLLIHLVKVDFNLNTLN